MGKDQEMDASRVNPPVFKMHPEEFAKLGLTSDQIKAILRLQLELAEKITRANLDYCIAVKDLSFWK